MKAKLVLSAMIRSNEWISSFELMYQFVHVFEDSKWLPLPRLQDHRSPHLHLQTCDLIGIPFPEGQNWTNFEGNANYLALFILELVCMLLIQRRHHLGRSGWGVIIVSWFQPCKQGWSSRGWKWYDSRVKHRPCIQDKPWDLHSQLGVLLYWALDFC